MNSLTRSHLRPGMTVWIVLKEDQRTGKRTRGVIKDILTKSPRHPHGIKVRLENGLVGRVQAIVEE
ncbi:MAG: YwbE family protein [Chloroflexota bacterium]